MRTLTETLTDLDAELAIVLEYPESAFGELLPRLEEKIDSYVRIIKYRESLAAFQKAEAKRCEELARSNEATVRWLKSKLQIFMENRAEEMGDLATPALRSRGKKLEGKLSKVSLCLNGGKPPIWVNPELTEGDFPAEFVEYIPRLDKNALAEAAIISGELRDGAGTLIARVMPRGTHLKIR
jgi:Siphovirus Gp157